MLLWRGMFLFFSHETASLLRELWRNASMYSSILSLLKIQVHYGTSSISPGHIPARHIYMVVWDPDSSLLSLVPTHQVWLWLKIWSELINGWKRVDRLLLVPNAWHLPRSHDLIHRTYKWLRRRTARIHAYIVHSFESCKKYFGRGVSRVGLEVDCGSPGEPFIVYSMKDSQAQEQNSIPYHSLSPSEPQVSVIRNTIIMTLRVMLQCIA